MVKKDFAIFHFRMLRMKHPEKWFGKNVQTDVCACMLKTQKMQTFLFLPWWKKIYILLRRKLQLSTPKYLEKLSLTTPNHAETTTIYEKVCSLGHVCR